MTDQSSSDSPLGAASQSAADNIGIDKARISQAELSWDDAGQPVSTHFNDIYFSHLSGLEETRFVFLHHNHLRERWQQLHHCPPQQINSQANALKPSASKISTHQLRTPHFTIGETGFGTGLNFLAAWQLWCECAPASANLHVVSVEMQPLSHRDLERALRLWPELNDYSAALLNAYPSALTPGFHRLQFDGGRVQLTLIIAEASDGFSQLLASPHPAFCAPQHRIDAWFLDGFAPAKNPDMWSDTLFNLIASLSATNATAATFTCAGIVKRGLQQAGFSIEKVPGFGLKREMLRAHLCQARPSPTPTDFPEGGFTSQHPVPWWATHALPQVSAIPPITTRAQTTEAIIIGAGLAGCHTAAALARRGWHVTIIDGEAGVAQQTSGNPQGVFYAKLSATAETLAEFNLTALQYAQRLYAPIWDNIGSRCGVLQLAESDNEQLQQSALIHRLGEQMLVQQLDRIQASAIAGIPLTCGGLYFANAGWINPAQLCESLCQHPNIRLLTGQHVDKLAHIDGRWHALAMNGDVIAQAPISIVCTANNASHFTQTAHLPITPVRGQISYLRSTPLSEQLQTVVCGEGYIAPAYQAQTQTQHCLGASFAPKHIDTELREIEHSQNLARLLPLSTELHATFADAPMAGRAALRATTPDYLPLVGPVADVESTRARFHLLSKNTRAAIAASVPCLPGLFVNVGHGSRGLCYTPICAELVASHINADIPPLAWTYIRALHPARFLIRDISRRR